MGKGEEVGKQDIRKKKDGKRKIWNTRQRNYNIDALAHINQLMNLWRTLMSSTYCIYKRYFISFVKLTLHIIFM